jgi:hypothetical protein
VDGGAVALLCLGFCIIVATVYTALH